MKQILLFFLGLATLSPAVAEDVHIAVAANFLQPAKQIAQAFERNTGHRVMISAGATGKFYAQIKSGAPFDVFLSADNQATLKLERENETVLSSRFTYATGKLALWSLTEKDPYSLLHNANFQHLAIASPQLAPYGRAALESLLYLKLWKRLQDQLVFGENIAQTFQFVDSKNAELGFIALSQIYQHGKIVKGYAWIVPQKYYQPILQEAVLLNKGKDNPAAHLWMDFLKSHEALTIMREFGYE